jgi:altronate hydrolase
MPTEETTAAPAALRLNVADNVGVALQKLPAGTIALGIELSQDVGAGHKFALRPIEVGQPALKFGQTIGFATSGITPGAHVHTHNLEFQSFARSSTPCEAFVPTRFVQPADRARFQGIVRADGRVATRNYVAILTTVNCSGTVARAIAQQIERRGLQDYPGVDGVIALAHTEGCGTSATGSNTQILQRTLAGYMKHPNIAGTVLLGLGCEANQGDALLERHGLKVGENLEFLTIQGAGGSQKALEQGLAAVLRMLPKASDVRRTPVSAEYLSLGLQCGGSDGYSGISANPALGVAVDLLVQHGGTAILSETPEIYGAEQLLTRRAVSPAVAARLLERVRFWEQHAAQAGASLNNNPSPGNQRGGLTTILEKSLGAVAKAGSTALMGVYEYAEAITDHGLVFMDSPGNDPYSATGQVASGANLICFTTGRGSVFGCKPTPSLKLSTNSALYARMTDDMDLDCGRVLTGKATLAELGQEIFDQLLRVASGERTKSELFGFGEAEFVPWRPGAVL